MLVEASKMQWINLLLNKFYDFHFIWVTDSKPVTAGLLSVGSYQSTARLMTNRVSVKKP